LDWKKDLAGSDPGLIESLFEQFPKGTDKPRKSSVMEADVFVEIRTQTLRKALSLRQHNDSH
jgi:hypothetical protein